MKQYTVLFSRGRYYAVDLSRAYEVGEYVRYPIIGNVCGYATINDAWYAVQVESEAAR